MCTSQTQKYIQPKTEMKVEIDNVTVRIEDFSTPLSVMGRKIHLNIEVEEDFQVITKQQNQQTSRDIYSTIPNHHRTYIILEVTWNTCKLIKQYSVSLKRLKIIQSIYSKHCEIRNQQKKKLRNSQMWKRNITLLKSTMVQKRNHKRK